jgi:hypothetical protein
VAQAATVAFNSIGGASFKGGTATEIRLDANDNAARTLLVKAENAGAGTADLTLDADDQITVGGTNTLAPIIQVDAGFNAEILNLSQTAGKSFGLFAGSGDPNGVVTASAGSLFVRETGATAHLYQNTTGGTVWTELASGGGALPVPTAEGEILYAVTAAAFVQATPLVNASGFLLVNSSGKMVVI